MLSRTTLIVELHEDPRRSVTELLQEAFSVSQTVELADQQPRDPAMFPEPAVLSAGERERALAEHRPGPQAWARFMPRRQRLR